MTEGAADELDGIVVNLAAILSTLDWHSVKAAGFPAGKYIDSPAGRRHLAGWAERGHAIGCHSYDHAYRSLRQLTQSTGAFALRASRAAMPAKNSVVAASSTSAQLAGVASCSAPARRPPADKPTVEPGDAERKNAVIRYWRDLSIQLSESRILGECGKHDDDNPCVPLMFYSEIQHVKQVDMLPVDRSVEQQAYAGGTKHDFASVRACADS